MEFFDRAMAIAFLALPPFLFFTVRNRLRAFVYATLVLWVLMIVGGQYRLAYTPGYDSMAPGLSIVAGWLPASIYAGIWFAIVYFLFSKRPNVSPEE